MFWLWTGFIAFVLLLLAFDLGVLNRRVHAISTREALAWTGMWVGIALAFNVAVYFIYNGNWFGILDRDRQLAHADQPTDDAAPPPGTPDNPAEHGEPGNKHASFYPETGADAAIMFLTGYVIEQSLSLDNMLVIAVIIGYFRIPSAFQHRLLFWGILATIILRGIMIIAGTALIHRAEWTLYLFGAILIYSAYKMFRMGEEQFDVESNQAVRLCRAFFRISPEFDGPRFFTRLEGQRALTPMMLALVVINVADVVFAVDSIPAIFAITLDPFLVFSSNIFAVLGLRALYFVLTGMMEKFHHIKTALIFVLLFIGAKMLLHGVYDVNKWISLGVVLGLLTVGAVASILFPGRQKQAAQPIPAPGAH